MRCPGCEFVSSDLRDICPRCYIDLRPHKELLGLKITNSKASYDELLSKQLPSGSRTRKAPNKQEAKNIGFKTPKPAPFSELPRKKSVTSLASTFFSKFKGTLFAREKTTPAQIAEEHSEDTNPTTPLPAQPEIVEPPIAPSPPPAPPVLDLSNIQEDISSILDSIIDQSEITIESVESDSLQVNESVSALSESTETTVEFEFLEEEIEESVKEQAEQGIEPNPVNESAPETLASLPILPSSSPPAKLPEAIEAEEIIEPETQQVAPEPVEIPELLTSIPVLPSSSPPAILPEAIEAEEIIEPEAQQVAPEPVEIPELLTSIPVLPSSSPPAILPEESEAEEIIEPEAQQVAPEPVQIPEPLASIPVLPSSSPPIVLPETSEIEEVFNPAAHLAEPVIVEEPMPEQFESSPNFSYSEPSVVAGIYQPEEQKAVKVVEPLYPELNAPRPFSNTPEYAFTQVILKEILPTPSEEVAPEIQQPTLEQTEESLAAPVETQEIFEPELSVPTNQQDLPPPEQPLDQLPTNGSKPSDIPESSLQTAKQHTSTQAAQSSTRTFELSPQQIEEASQYFDLLQAQSWPETRALELSADSLGLSTDMETVELLFNLSLESLTNPDVQHVLEKDIDRSESRHITTESLEQQLKSVEQQLSKSVVTLKGTRGSHSPAPDQPPPKPFDFSEVAPSFKQRTTSIICDLAVVAFAGAIFSLVLTISTEVNLPSTENFFDFAIGVAPVFSRFIVTCFILLPIYTIAAFFVLGNTVGGIVSKIEVRTSNGKDPKPANLILRGLALPISLFLPSIRLQDRISHTLACRSS